MVPPSPSKSVLFLTDPLEVPGAARFPFFQVFTFTDQRGVLGAHGGHRTGETAARVLVAADLADVGDDGAVGHHDLLTRLASPYSSRSTSTRLYFVSFGPRRTDGRDPVPAHRRTVLTETPSSAATWSAFRR